MRMIRPCCPHRVDMKTIHFPAFIAVHFLISAACTAFDANVIQLTLHPSPPDSGFQVLSPKKIIISIANTSNSAVLLTWDSAQKPGLHFRDVNPRARPSDNESSIRRRRLPSVLVGPNSQRYLDLYWSDWYKTEAPGRIVAEYSFGCRAISFENQNATGAGTQVEQVDVVSAGTLTFEVGPHVEDTLREEFSQLLQQGLEQDRQASSSSIEALCAVHDARSVGYLVKAIFVPQTQLLALQCLAEDWIAVPDARHALDAFINEPNSDLGLQTVLDAYLRSGILLTPQQIVGLRSAKSAQTRYLTVKYVSEVAARLGIDRVLQALPDDSPAVKKAAEEARVQVSGQLRGMSLDVIKDIKESDTDESTKKF